MKVTFNYDPNSGNINDANGFQYFIGYGLNIASVEPDAPKNSGTGAALTATDRLIEKGTKPDELIKLRQAGVI